MQPSIPHTQYVISLHLCVPVVYCHSADREMATLPATFAPAITKPAQPLDQYRIDRRAEVGEEKGLKAKQQAVLVLLPLHLEPFWLAQSYTYTNKAVFGYFHLNKFYDKSEGLPPIILQKSFQPGCQTYTTFHALL